MRCIETKKMKTALEREVLINYNMRCIETNEYTENSPEALRDKLQHEMY